MSKSEEDLAASAHIRQQAEFRFVPESALALGVALSVKEMVNAGIDYAENYPVLAEVAHLSGEPLLEKLSVQSYSDMLRSEMLDYLDDYRATGKRTEARAAFDHFIGNAANTYHMVLRNSMTREKYSPVLESLPSLARIMRIVNTKQPKSLYDKIREESVSRVKNTNLSWQAWLAEV
ncbi:MAG: hypothetical protein WA194_00600 [Patescibacteria group bacterium]